MLRKAGSAYEAVYQKYGDNKSYNAVNAATLYLLAGDDRASEMAGAALAECEQFIRENEFFELEDKNQTHNLN